MRNALRMVLTVIVAVPLVSSSAHAFAVRQFHVGATPGALAAGRDGSMWFAAYEAWDDSTLTRITRTGATRVYPIYTHEHPGRLVVARDGSIWFCSAFQIDHLVPDGRLVAPVHPRGVPEDLALGSDGSVWFSTQDGNVGRIAPSGDVTYAAVNDPGPIGVAHRIALGPDGRMWAARGDAVVAITDGGSVSRYPIPGASAITHIARGPDGQMWVTALVLKNLRTVIARIAMDGHVSGLHLRRGTGADREFKITHLPRAMIAAGGRMWLSVASELIDISPSGRVTEHGPHARGSSGVPLIAGAGRDLAVADDGRLWVSDQDQPWVGRVTTGPACSVPPVVGMHLTAARAALVANGCRVAVPNAAPARAVVAWQSSAAGSVVARGATVRLTLGAAQPCRLPQDARTLLDNGVAVVASFKVDRGLQYVGCARGTGHVVRLGMTVAYDNGGHEDVSWLRLAGTYVAFDDAPGFADVVAQRLMSIDLSGRGRNVTVPLPGDDDVLDLAVSSTGPIAWIDRSTVTAVHAASPDTTVTLDSNPILSRLTIDATGVRWTSAGAAKSAAIP